jgi:hypothetical protein
MILAGITSDAYKFFFLLHIIAVIAGFGPTFAYPLLGAVAKRRQGSEGEAISAATLEVGHILEYAIYAVPVFGVVLVLLSDDVWEFSQTWVWASILVYAAALTVSLGMHVPNLRRMNALQKELVAMGPPPAGAPTGGPPPQVVELEERGKRAGMFGGTLHVLLTVILVLMIWKPGT